MTNRYRIAGRNICVTSLYDEVHQLCSRYAAPDAAPDFSVRTTYEDIEYERERSARGDQNAGIPVRQFSDAYLETLAVYRRIAEEMPVYDTFLFHGSAVAVDGAAYLFTAKSGTGKSTHTRLWRELLGARAVMVNDDKPLRGFPARERRYVPVTSTFEIPEPMPQMVLDRQQDRPYNVNCI